MTIICATDFSPPSQLAEAVARHWAERLHAALVVAHAIEPAWLPPKAALDPTFLPRLREAATGELEREAAALGAADRVIVEDSSPVKALVDLAQSREAEMLVVGSHGRTGTGRLLLGSVSERIVKLASCPVLVVPARLSATAPYTTDAGPSRGVPKIVVALDAGPAGDAAVAWIRRLRQHVACDVSFVHIYDPQREHARLGITGSLDPFADESEVEAVLARELAPQIAGLPGPGTKALRLLAWHGRQPDPLAWEASTDEADLLVIGIVREPGGFLRRATLATLRHATVPVLCVPAAARPETKVKRRIPALDRVLAPTDLSDFGNAAVIHAYQLLRGSGGTVEICHAIEPPREGLDPELEAALEERLYALVPEEARRFGIATRATILESGLPKDAIVQAAERFGVDMIVLGSHGRSGLGRAVLGSVADAVVRTARMPVVVVRAQT